MNYQAFLDSKVNLGDGHGFEPIELPSFLKPFQALCTSWAIRRGRAALFEAYGLGKGLRPECPILTPTGWRPIGDLEIGDLVIGSDGLPYPVSGVFFKDEQNLYRIVFSDDSSIECDGDHLWNVKSPTDISRGKPWRTMGTFDLAHTKLRYSTSKQTRTWKIPLVSPVEFDGRDLPIHPYVLGVLLGDGSLSGGLRVQWTKNDPEIAERIRSLLPEELHVRQTDDEGRGTLWAISQIENRRSNPILNSLRDLGLMGLKSPEKFVPAEYLFSSIEDRIALLQGLMDTDGYAGESSEFTSSSRDLADSVVFIVRSLGGIASLNCKEQPTYTHAGENRIGLPSWRVVLTMPPGINPFSLARKADKFKTPSRGRGRWIDSIEPAGRAKTVCISVDSPDNLFVADQFLVTHNSIQELVWAENVVRHTNRPVLLLTPLAVGPQMVREARKFGIPDVEQSRTGRYTGKIVVSNYERLHYFKSSDFAGIVCDESGCLKDESGKTKAAIAEFARVIPYRLLCTAMPAPNDYDELGTSADILGEMGYQDMITRFFRQQTKKDYLGWGRTKYCLRGHAEHDFWRWICSWARACRKPSDLGFEDDGYILPGLINREHVIIARTKRDGFLFDLPAITLDDQREERRRTIKERCEKVAELVAHDRPAIAWGFLNDECDLLTRMIPGAVQVSGSDKEEVKEERLMDFVSGKVRVMVSKPSIFGYGLNLQHCAHMTFFPSHSFEQADQAIHRCHRFGQASPVTVDMIASEGEAGVLANLQRKSEQAEVMFAKLVSLMHDHLNIARTNPFTQQAEVPSWL